MRGDPVHWFRTLGDHVLVFASIVASSWVATRLISLPPTHMTAIWLPAGISLIAFRSRLGWWSAPTIILAIWAVVAMNNHYAYFTFRPWSVLLCAMNVVQTAIAAWIWRKWLKGSPFSDAWDFLRFVVGVAPAPPRQIGRAHV